MQHQDSGQAPSLRQDFFHVTLFECPQPQVLPYPYSWLSPGDFAFYRGEIEYPDRANRADWAWEIAYTNGKTSSGEPASLGYSLFLSQESEWFGKAAGLPLRPTPTPEALRRAQGVPLFTPGFPDPRRRQMPMGLSLPTLFPCVSQPPQPATTMIKTVLGTMACFTLPRHGLGFMKGLGYYEAGKAMLVGMDIGDAQKMICSFRLTGTNVTLDTAGR